ncbi:MAG: dynamin family protein [Zoogloeaceae bacterium]|jgi:prefoldin subunit 5|nr:dynamin family protein [Zoogloeaceae bacterium]
MSLALQFAVYSQWRLAIIAATERFRQWLIEQDLSDAQTEQRLSRLEERIREDKLHVAFVAEFSRGKSELINSIFFTDYGNRILPSSAGRTTMCPTELLHAAGKPPAIDLLSIQTRGGNTSVSEYKQNPDAWRRIPLDIRSAKAMRDALRQVSETIRVPAEEAGKLGFTVDETQIGAFHVGEDGLVEIPRWRHAIINFPHPLLEQGLVILDTPGLNAIGTEPELTLSLLPNAHAVLFILAADTGVTQSDLLVWQDHIASNHGKRGRLVVLNKIDGLWDELKSEAEIDAEITRQAKSCADILGIHENQIFPVSAQKGLVAKINQDASLLIKSRLPELEAALSDELIPAKHDIVRDDAQREFGEIHQHIQELLEVRHANLSEQIGELSDLRGKNRSVVEYMMGKIQVEKEEFDAGLQHYYAVRSVFSTLTNKLFAHLGVKPLRQRTEKTRQAMSSATFSRQISRAIHAFFQEVQTCLKKSNAEIKEIRSMMDSVYKRLHVEHGLQLAAPADFSLAIYEKEIQRLESWCDTHLNNAIQFMTHEKNSIAHKFFEEIAMQAQKIFARANWDVESWLKIIMSPVETQVREHQLHLKRRLDSVQRIHEAADTLEERINELGAMEGDLQQQIKSLDAIARAMQTLMGRPGDREQKRAAGADAVQG